MNAGEIIDNFDQVDFYAQNGFEDTYYDSPAETRHNSQKNMQN